MNAQSIVDDLGRAKGDDIQERVIDFAVAIITICEQLPNTPSGKHVGGQLLRSGTSPTCNYGEARGAESRNDFTQKLGIVLKELNETAIGLEIAKRSEMLSADTLAFVQKECAELQRIIGASIRTAGRGKR